LKYSNTIHGVKATLRRCEAKLVASPRCLPRAPQAPRSKPLGAQRLSGIGNELPIQELLAEDDDHHSRRCADVLVRMMAAIFSLEPRLTLHDTGVHKRREINMTPAAQISP
jgi:hypothetical protein